MLGLESIGFFLCCVSLDAKCCVSLGALNLIHGHKMDGVLDRVLLILSAMDRHSVEILSVNCGRACLRIAEYSVSTSESASR